MNYDDPLLKTKEQYVSVINKIKSDKSEVGIDAQYTHAIILDYLQQITQRLNVLEEELKKERNHK